MIKKILLTFLMITMCGFANADQCFKLSARAAASALSNDTELQIKILAAHRHEIKNNEALHKCFGGKINAESFWKLCSMAGIDIKTQNGKMQCYNKVAELVEYNGTYYRTCGTDATKLGSKGTCINVFKDIQVQTTQGIALAQEYVLKRFNLKGLKCNNERRPADNTDAIKYANQDFVQCYLPATQTYFEFEFDDLKESTDERIRKDFSRGVCIIHDKKVEEDTIFGGLEIGNIYCITSQSECTSIKKTAEKLGGTATHQSEEKNEKSLKQYPNNGCKVNMSSTVWNRKDLKTAYGIDNFMFCNGGGLQFQNTGGLTDALKTYVANAAKVSTSSVRCDAATKKYMGSGCNSNGFTFKDDIISCYVGTNQIDFVFDDVNEFSHRYAQGAQQGLDCIVAGGTYTGKKCMHLGEEQCETLRLANLKNCPECKTVKWDGNNCTLPSSKTATNLKKGADIAMIVGGAIVGIVLTIATAGESGTPVLAWVLTSIETVGAGIELTSQLKIDGIADDFFAQSGKCKDAKCAEDLLKKYFDRLINVQGDMNEIEISAANDEIARLAEIIPDDAPIWEQIGDNLILEENAKGLFEGWEPEQIWRAIGIGLQFASVGVAITKFLFGKSPHLQKATKVLAKKLRASKRFKKEIQILSKAQDVALANYVDYDKLDDIGKEVYKVWEEFAPKNQTYFDFYNDIFMDLNKGDLNQMRKVANNWKTVKQAAENIDGTRNIVNTKQSILDDLMDKHDIDAIPEKYDAQKEFFEKYPDIEKAYKDKENAKALLNSAESYKENRSFYSTYDPEFEMKFADYAKKQKELGKLKDKIYNDVDIETDEYQVLQKQIKTKESEVEKAEKALPDQWEIGEEFQLKNIKKVNEDRFMAMALTEDPEVMIDWAKLNDNQRLEIAQNLVDRYAERLGTPKAKLHLDYKTNLAGYYTPGTRDIYINPKAQFDYGDGYVQEILSHEYAHLVDDQMPNMGALGEQYNKWSDKIYSGNTADGYNVALTEQSSYNIGYSNLGTTQLEETTNELKETIKNVKALGTAVGAAAAAGAGALVIQEAISEDD